MRTIYNVIASVPVWARLPQAGSAISFAASSARTDPYQLSYTRIFTFLP